MLVMKTESFPKVVKVGHTIVKIYHALCRGSDLYTVSYYIGNQRVRKNFADLSLATFEAEQVADKLSKGEIRVLELKNEDRFNYVRSLEALAPTGVSLEWAAIQFAEAFKILDGRPVVEAARFYAKHHPVGMQKLTVPAVVKELLDAKEMDGASAVYLKDLRGRLGRFEEKFKGSIEEVTGADIEGFLRGLKNGEEQVLSGRSRNNYRRAIGTLLYFAESRGYLPRGLVEVESVAVAKEATGDIEVFRPEELKRVLARAVAEFPELVPFIGIGAFAGLRHAELQRLDWSEVRLEDGFIEVKASKAKTASRRLVPIAPNLKEWLTPYWQPAGEVTAFANMSKQLMWLAESVDQAWRGEDPPGRFVWKHNALRHSFISYRVAETQNVAQVALEAGNSPRVVFSNYRELVRPKDAAAWFGIRPEGFASAMSAHECA